LGAEKAENGAAELERNNRERGGINGGEREWKLRREGGEPVERESGERERGDFFLGLRLESFCVLPD
jgi:hypothetical protein